MSVKYFQTCYICGTRFDLNEYDDACPCCGWYYLSGYEEEMDEDEKESPNYISIKEAKSLFKRGLDVFGKPIKLK